VEHRFVEHRNYSKLYYNGGYIYYAFVKPTRRMNPNINYKVLVIRKKTMEVSEEVKNKITI
jgi:hypothetical protein